MAHRSTGVGVIDILDILTGVAGEEADARARMPLPDGPMRSLATLGVPPIYPGNLAGGIPLSRITDVAWRDASDFAAPAQTSYAESSVPLSHLTDVLLRDTSVLAPDEQGMGRGTSARAWSDRGNNNVLRIVVRPRPIEPPMTLDGGAEIPSNRPDPQSYPNIDANVDPALADDRFDLREQGRHWPEDVTPTYDRNRILKGEGTFAFGDDFDDRLVPASWPGTPIRAAPEHDHGSGAPPRWYADGLGPNDAFNPMAVAPAARATSFAFDIPGSIIPTVDPGAGVPTVGHAPYGTTNGTFRQTGQRFESDRGPYHYRARASKPSSGWFMQFDPIGNDGGAIPHAYVGNDPLNLFAPLRLAADGLGDRFGGLVRDFGRYLRTGADALAGIPRGIGKLADDFTTRPGDTTLSVLNSFPQTRLGSSSVAALGVAASAARRLAANAARGRAFERSVLEALNLLKNNRLIAIQGVGRSIPDALTRGVVEIKSGIEVNNSIQLQVHAAYARLKRVPFNLVVGPATQRISQSVKDQVKRTGGTIQRFDPATGVFGPFR